MKKYFNVNDPVKVNRVKELACYRQFPSLFKTLYGQPLWQTLSAYSGMIDDAEVSLSEADIRAINDPDADIFKYVFGHEPGDFDPSKL